MAVDNSQTTQRRVPCARHGCAAARFGGPCCRIRRSFLLRPAVTARVGRSRLRLADRGRVDRCAAPAGAAARCGHLFGRCRRRFHLAAAFRCLRARAVLRPPRRRPARMYRLARHGSGRPWLSLCVRQRRDPGIDGHVPPLRHREERNHADRRVPVLLRLHRLRRAFTTEAWRLLCVLFVWFRALSPDPGRRDPDMPAPLTEIAFGPSAGPADAPATTAIPSRRGRTGTSHSSIGNCW